MSIILKRHTPIGYGTSLAKEKRTCCKATERIEPLHQNKVDAAMEAVAVDAAVEAVDAVNSSPTRGKLSDLSKL